VQRVLINAVRHVMKPREMTAGANYRVNTDFKGAPWEEK
jgi:hypothetical protein